MMPELNKWPSCQSDAICTDKNSKIAFIHTASCSNNKCNFHYDKHKACVAFGRKDLAIAQWNELTVYNQPTTV